MRGRAHAIHMARRRVGPFIKKLEATSPTKWPDHLSIANKLLDRKSALAKRKICPVVFKSIEAAHACAKAIDRQSNGIVRFQSFGKLRQDFKVFANCAKRAPASLRRQLNERIFPLIRDNDVDSELIETIIDATVAVFAEYPETEAARTALREDPLVKYDRAAKIKNDYEVLAPSCRRKIEYAIRGIAKAPNKETIASDIFRSMASALNPEEINKESAKITPHIVDYVASLADLWRGVGLSPARAWDYEKPTYMSKFHYFSDLILTAVVEPWSQRHTKSVDKIREDANNSYSNLPAAVKKYGGPAPKRSDMFTLVKDDHIKEALLRFKKMA